MKIVKVSIIDENTLVLLEYAEKENKISLKNYMREIDKSNISDVVKSKIKVDV